MPTPSEIMDMSASLMNDTAQSVYTDTVQLPYLNMALNELQEIFEHNNIPITNEESTALVIPDGTTVVSFTSSPALPSDLIEIQRLWERTTGIPPYIPMDRVEFIPKSREGISTSQFSIWSWIDEEIRLVAATSIIDFAR